MWEKVAFYHLPANRPKEALSHAQLPTALVLGNVVRVFFACRNEKHYSSIYFVNLSVKDSTIGFSEFSPQPVLAPGDIGTFDEHGVFPSCIVRDRGKYFMYYIGWNQGVEPPLFYASIGLALSGDGKSFEKCSPAPILGRSEWDACLVTSPHVYIEDGLWRMTYVSGTKWTRLPSGRLQSHYHIKHAESSDGFSWRRDGRVAIDFREGETNIARSSVIRDKSGYRMWYSYVHSKIGKYRIGFAKSQDGYSWERRDEEALIDVDGNEARDMICYPCVFSFKKAMYMLYNGDNFGQQGFGVAVWRSPDADATPRP